MNCEQGDLAIVVSGQYAGSVVVCVQFLGDIDGFVKDFWRIDRCLDHENIGIFSDGMLRPLRDNHGQDETLQWAPVPKKETA